MPSALPSHPFCCNRSRRLGQTSRHLRLNSSLCAIASDCGFQVISEPSYTAPGGDSSLDALRPDAVFSGRGISKMIDVSVVCSCAPSYRAICQAKPAAAIARRCQVKRTHYRRLVLEQRCSFSPVVFDALGVPSRQAVDLVTFLASSAVSSGIVPPSSQSSFIKIILTKLVFAVFDGNLDMCVDCWGHSAAQDTAPSPPPDRRSLPDSSPSPVSPAVDAIDTAVLPRVFV